MGLPMLPPRHLRLDDDIVYLCNAESRNKIYRLLQYGAKTSKWMLMTAYQLKQEDLRDSHNRPPVLTPSVSITSFPIDAEKPSPSVRNGRLKHPTIQTLEQRLPHPSNTESPGRRRAKWLARLLARVEALFGDARKVYRFFQFIEMLDMLRHVREPDRVVRILRRTRILCFFFFYLLENYMVFLLRIEGFSHRHPRVVMLKRSCNGFWCLSILLAFPLDYLLHRSGVLSTAKKLLDLPVAYLAFADQRVSDGIFGLLGIASAQIGVYLRWIDVVAKLRHKRLLQTNCLLNDVA
ncbi:hypothetical protein P43SY_003746 [Pythium insidiosum]|uniref:Uncharacterized protein n=1 Tax=Pythium insidiosum TaxID=114742 RepID=A0AAD5LYA6_PYTIN|nr:hypothetical protein P43SY_003746 [Pythium insidiosum]